MRPLASRVTYSRNSAVCQGLRVRFPLQAEQDESSHAGEHDAHGGIQDKENEVSNHAHRSIWKRGGHLSKGWQTSFPVVLHVHDAPAPGLRLVERFIEMADAGLAIVGPLALCIGVPYKARRIAHRPPATVHSSIC